MKKLKDTDVKIISSLIVNSRTSDRQLAKFLGVSQPTVTRRRKLLEREHIFSYTAITDLSKLGFEVLAFNFVSLDTDVHSSMESEELDRKLSSTFSSNPNIVFASSGDGLGKSGIAVSVHKSFSDHAEFKQQLENDWGMFNVQVESFFISLKSDRIRKMFDLSCLTKILDINSAP